MIPIKNKKAIQLMREGGKRLAAVVLSLQDKLKVGVSTLFIDEIISEELKKHSLISSSKGYLNYKYNSCISVNSVVVHGVPSKTIILNESDIVKIDVCANYKGYCLDMARIFIIGDEKKIDPSIMSFLSVAQKALDIGIANAREGNRVHDISASIQNYITPFGYGIIKEFAGHGIGKKLHELPDVPNYGIAGTGAKLLNGMTLAIEPMISLGNEAIVIDADGWTARTSDSSLAAHVEDTILITNAEPEILTRL